MLPVQFSPDVTLLRVFHRTGFEIRDVGDESFVLGAVEDIDVIVLHGLSTTELPVPLHLIRREGKNHADAQLLRGRQCAARDPPN